VHVSDVLFLQRLTSNAFVHTSYSHVENWGNIASNGLILLDGKNAFLFDTPMDDSVTQQLVTLIEEKWGYQLAGFVPNHWHNDCTAGLDQMHKKNIPTYGNAITNKLLFDKNEPMLGHTFEDSLVLAPGNLKILLYFPGEAHTSDNIVVWIPTEKILFGGCMVKSMEAKTMGNVADANLTAWPLTIGHLQQLFQTARFVIPGHGAYGGTELFNHTLELLKSSQN
jgi:metallo-beta-lactamase class B